MLRFAGFSQIFSQDLDDMGSALSLIEIVPFDVGDLQRDHLAAALGTNQRIFRLDRPDQFLSL